MVTYIIDFSKVSKHPLNPMDRTLRTFIYNELYHCIYNNNNVSSIILYGGHMKNVFTSGADITEFEQLFTTPVSVSTAVSTTISTTNTTTTINNSKKIQNPSLLDIIDLIDASPTNKPIIACIYGICYGGGLELVLACHYRIVAATESVSSTKLALPEIHVGVIPGGGGTQRLSRCIGLQLSLQYILSGQSISTKQAMQMKLIDAIVDIKENDNRDELLNVAKQWAYYAESIPNVCTSRRISSWNVPDVSSPAQVHAICHLATLSLGNTITNSHKAIIEACRTSCLTSYHDGMKVEYELFIQVLNSIEGKARRHIFFATRATQKVVLPSSQQRRQIQQPSKQQQQQQHTLLLDPKQVDITVAVIGAGTMGSGIAISFLLSGYTVYFVDVSKDALQKGITTIETILQSYVTKKVLSKQMKDFILQTKFITTQSLLDLQHCHLIIEAIIENLNIKQGIFRQLHTILNNSNNHQCIIVSNTSTLDIDRMASVFIEQEEENNNNNNTYNTTRITQFAGLHFFSPAHIMKLVEIIYGTYTSQETISILQSITKRIQKISVVIGNCDGFCGNRMLRPYSAETVLLLVERPISNNNNNNTIIIPPTIEQVDYAFKNVFGMALGPFEMSDLAGNDIGYNIRNERGWVRDPKNDHNTIPTRRPTRYTELADDMVSQLHRYGQKVHKGWYDYNPKIGKGRKPIHSIEMYNFIQQYIVPTTTTVLTKKQNNTTTNTMSNDEMIERVLFPLVNEGFKCLEEQIVYQPSDIDIVYIYGYGFPITKGGPMFWADHIITLPKLLYKLQQFYTLYPTTEHYKPSQLLIDCVQHNMTLNEYWKKYRTRPVVGRNHANL